MDLCDWTYKRWGEHEKEPGFLTGLPLLLNLHYISKILLRFNESTSSEMPLLLLLDFINVGQIRRNLKKIADFGLKRSKPLKSKGLVFLSNKKQGHFTTTYKSVTY